MMHILT